jgi:uncharacterized protein (DUF1697 family)
MKFIALLRGINAGNARRIDMHSLKLLFEKTGYKNVETYLNSGNVIFETAKQPAAVRRDIEAGIKQQFGFAVPTLIKSRQELRAIAGAIPAEWQNNSTWKSEVAYLFAEIDSEKILDELPVNPEFLDIRYTPGAVFWKVARQDYNQSRLNKIIGHKYYQLMTVRNVNTARNLAGLTSTK